MEPLSLLYLSPTKSYPAMTLDVGKVADPGVPDPPKAGWSMSMPVSMIPILIHLPVNPSVFLASVTPVSSPETLRFGLPSSF